VTERTPYTIPCWSVSSTYNAVKRAQRTVKSYSFPKLLFVTSPHGTGFPVRVCLPWTTKLLTTYIRTLLLLQKAILQNYTGVKKGSLLLL
jgi:hypothetical protein